jgi:hypothetical protein
MDGFYQWSEQNSWIFLQALRLMLFLIDFPELNKPKWNHLPAQQVVFILNFFCCVY